MLGSYRELLKTSGGRSKLAWLAYTFVVSLAAGLRFWNLGNPHKLVFDETYYVKDAYTLSQAGVELGWPQDPDLNFIAGKVDTFLQTPAFVVHPPLGKWLIALGLNIFGADNSFGWRFSAALFGTLTVALVILVAWQMLRSVTWSAAAGFLMAIDGHAIVLSRTALLDGFLGFFVLLAFYFLLRDREQNRLRLFAAPATGLIWARPWLVACAVALGAATAVKWSGLWFALAFGLYASISEAFFKRQIRTSHFLDDDKPIAATVRQTAVNLILMGPTFALTYLATWTGWLLSDRGWDATWATAPANEATGILAWVPIKLQSLWRYHQDAFGFHVNLHSPHSYASNPLTWLLLGRPTSFFYEGVDKGADGCGFDGGCSSAITALGNPLIWYAATTAVIFLFIRYLRVRESAAGLVLLGIAAGYLPWLLYMNRTIFQFYSIAFLPWLILGLILVLKRWLQSAPSELRPKYEHRMLGYFATVSLVSAFFYPIWSGMQVPYWFWYIHMWLPSWI